MCLGVIGGIATKYREIGTGEGLGGLVVVWIGFGGGGAAGGAVAGDGRRSEACGVAERRRGSVGVGLAFRVGGIHHCGR